MYTNVCSASSAHIYQDVTIFDIDVMVLDVKKMNIARTEHEPFMK